MIRVYFIFEDPLDQTGVNLSYVDIATQRPAEALERVERAAESGALWRNLYPEDEEPPYALLKDKMMCLDITALPSETNAVVLL